MNQAVEFDLRAHIGALADSGNSYGALSLLEALQADHSVEARVLHSRILRHLGNDSRSLALDIQIWHRHPHHPEAMTGFARTLAARRGLYRAWQWTNESPLPSDSSAEMTAEWHAMRANFAANLRDWDTAGRLFAEARTLAPDAPWILVENAYGLAFEDRYSEAIDMARAALAVNPDYRTAIQALAWLQSMSANDEAAIELLQRASARMQSADLEMQLNGLLTEHQRFDEAWIVLQRAREFSPLSDRARRMWFEKTYAANLLARGHLRDALEHCRSAGDAFHLAIARNIEALAPGDTPRRVLLDVGFVRQQHMTCSPATLSALSNYWGHPAEHLEIAEEICYDGTPHHSERAWTERSGFVAREFTASWTVTKQLIDAGVPFTLTTRNTNSAHLQAVIGYDEIRRTLLLRDPTQRIHTEFEADALFESQRASGPRGMLVIPREEAHRISGIVLPDAEHWDRYHEVMLALNQHDRGVAQKIADRQQAHAPEHWLTLWSLLGLAIYDGDVTTIADLARQLIGLFGERAELLLQWQRALDQFASRDRMLEVAEDAVGRHPRDVALLTQLAGLHAADARDLGRARYLATRALRESSVDAGAWQAMANVLWLCGERYAALEHYRIAACIGDLSEDMASAYGRACRALGFTERGLTWLAARQQRLGNRSAGPTITYFCELENLERTADAFQLAVRVLENRPDDDVLRLFFAQKYLQHGEIDRAKIGLGAVKSGSSLPQRLSVEAALAQREGRIDDAWAAIADACRRDPLRLDLRRQAADILSQRSGRRAAIDDLREVCSRHRTVIALHSVLLEWLASESLQEREAVLRHVLTLNDRSAFTWRELAINLTGQKRMPEAWDAARRSLALAPNDANTYAVLASLHFSAGEIKEGQEQCREALRRSVDQEYALNMLVTTCNSHEERRAALGFTETQLSEQTTQGNALLLFQSQARSSLPYDELESRLDALRARRSELWQAWLASTLQRIDSGRLDDALELLEQSVERFPFNARLHYEMARIAAIQHRVFDARESIRRALQLQPAWDWAIRLYVELALAEASQAESALELLESPLSRTDESAGSQILRGRVLWQLRRREEAMEAIERALLRWPDRVDAWQHAFAWTRERGESDRVRRLATRITELYPHETNGWIRLADSAATLEEALSATDRALALEPFSQLAYIARLNAFIRYQRFDAVLQAVNNAPWGENSPTAIRRYRARALWQQQQRDAAILAIREFLALEPNDASLWQDLSDWLDTTTRLDEYLEAARELVRLTPAAAIAHGHLGQALRKRNEIGPAIESLRTAFGLDHNYAFAGFTLADLLLQTQWQDAPAVLRVLREKFPGPGVAIRELQYAVASENTAMMPQILREIVRASQLQTEPFQNVEKLLRKGHRRQLLLESIRDACADGEACEPAIGFWLEKEFDLWDSALLEHLEPYLKVDHNHRLKIQLIELVTKSRQYAVVPQLVERYGDVMRTNSRAWGEVSYGLVTADRYHEAVEWLHDWRREDAPWWALDNLAIAMRNLGMHDVAHEVSTASHTKDSSRPDAMVWLAIDAALVDDLDATRFYLDKIRDVQQRPFYQSMKSLAVAYLHAIGSGRTATLDSAFAKVRRLSKEQKTLAWLMRELRRKWAGRATGWKRLFRLALLR